jgi:hypothetical protein
MVNLELGCIDKLIWSFCNIKYVPLLSVKTLKFCVKCSSAIRERPITKSFQIFLYWEFWCKLFFFKKKKKQDHFFFLVFPFLPSSILWKANFIIDLPYQKQKALVIDIVKEFQTVLFVNCFASAAINNS